MNGEFAVIGSGLSAIGAIKALIELGFCPTVIDVGIKLDQKVSEKIHELSKKDPSEWTYDERLAISANPTINDKSKIPKKLVFGSDYFYGGTTKNAPIESSGNMPPLSYALGGLSAGWGAAALPPQACDLDHWPISAEELTDYCKKVLKDLPYSAKNDGLSLDFDLLSEYPRSLIQSESAESIHNALKSAGFLKKGKMVFGQSRLLVNTDNKSMGCRYCGECMSGCVYGAIYKASDDILKFQRAGKIKYVSGYFVEKLEENSEGVVLTCQDSHGATHKLQFGRVFLAAGAVNTTRIVMNSLDLFDHKVGLLSRGGFVIPMISLRRLPTKWPQSNTQPGLFIEAKGGGLKHWVHMQISTENELIFRKLGVGSHAGNIFSKIKKFIASHIVLVLMNYHSDHAGKYDLWLEKLSENERSSTRLRTAHQAKFPQLNVWLFSWMRLCLIFGRIGILPLLPLAKLNSGAYHVGGTLPMRENPSAILDTDIMGRLSKWDSVHVVDTACFPSLPGTTIGLLAMANAYRIVSKLDLNK